MFQPAILFRKVISSNRFINFNKGFAESSKLVFCLSIEAQIVGQKVVRIQNHTYYNNSLVIVSQN